MKAKILRIPFTNWYIRILPIKVLEKFNRSNTAISIGFKEQPYKSFDQTNVYYLKR